MTTAAKELGEQPAFPCPESLGPNGEICRCDGRGLTKRELFAAIITHAIIHTGTASGLTVGDCEKLLELKQGEYKPDVHYPILIAQDAEVQTIALLEQLAKQ